MAGQTRASGTQLVRWAGAPSGEADAKSFGDEALGVLKSRYSDPDWLTFAPKIMDPLRENRAKALQAFLIAKRDAATGELTYRDVNGLFDHFLIDTQMSACSLLAELVRRTSRCRSSRRSQ